MAGQESVKPNGVGTYVVALLPGEAGAGRTVEGKNIGASGAPLRVAFFFCFLFCFTVFMCFLVLVFFGVLCYFCIYFWIPLVFLRRLHQFSLKKIDSGRFLGRFICSRIFVFLKIIVFSLNFGVHQYFFLQQYVTGGPVSGGPLLAAPEGLGARSQIQYMEYDYVMSSEIAPGHMSLGILGKSVSKLLCFMSIGNGWMCGGWVFL